MKEKIGVLSGYLIMLLVGLIIGTFFIPKPFLMLSEKKAESLFGGRIELSQNPQYLFDEEFNPNKITLYGVGLGDDEYKINQSLITERTESVGWIHTDSNLTGVSYRVVNGKIVEFALKEGLIKKTGLLREDEIIIRFGNPDELKKETGFLGNNSYYYIDKGLIIRVNISNKEIYMINILGK